MITLALAGHAGESGLPLLMPHEWMEILAALAILDLVPIVLLALILRFLIRLERRLCAIERIVPVNRPAPPLPDPADRTTA